jgi:hypothetical protein
MGAKRISGNGLELALELQYLGWDSRLEDDLTYCSYLLGRYGCAQVGMYLQEAGV